MKIVMVWLLFIGAVWSQESRRYVCYTKKDIKGIYIGCTLSHDSCQKRSMMHFGKYPDKSSTRKALFRCQHAIPRKKAKKTALRQISVEKVGTKNSYERFGLSGTNKQDRYYERLRSMIISPLPGFIKKQRKGLELFVLDNIAEGYMALYRSPMSSGTYLFEVLIYSKKGQVLDEVDLSELIRSGYKLEVQDIRLKDGILYFNAASATYASATKGRSAALYAYDLLHKKLLWKSKYLVSNDIFLVEDGYIISGYGFTGERDHLYLLDRETGKVLSKKRLDSAHDYLEIQGDRLYVITYHRFYTFKIEGK